MAQTSSTRVWVKWASVVLWAATIFSMSAVPGSRIPGRFGTLAHFIEYAVLAFLVMWALAVPLPRLSGALWSIVIASAYGVTDEIHQLFVPMRMADPADWAVDTAGAIAGALLYLALTRLVRRDTRKPQ